MSKSIILCCDGTWNKPETEHEQVTPTNVLRLVRSICPRANNRDQVVYYDSGVGTGGLWDKWVGGAMGVGLSDNIMEAYRFLVNNWAEGDTLYFFGFSRGAYTVRSLAGLVHEAGLLPKYHMPHFPALYAYFRTPPAERLQHPASARVADLLNAVDALKRRPRINFLGVWDTVGALGLPIPGLRRLSQQWVGFHDTQLSDTVQFAVQALAIDELRKLFAPDLWTHHPDATTEQMEKDENRVLQVWFAGSHSDVGGGYPETELSDLALDLLMDQAEQHGLQFERFGLEQSPLPGRFEGPLHNEYRRGYALQKAYPRPIGKSQRSIAGLQRAINERIHYAAVKRANSSAEMLNRENLQSAISAGVPLYYPRRQARLALVPGQSRTAVLNSGLACELLDYSEGGARIRCPDKPAQLALSGISHPIFGHRDSKVVWQKDDEFGLQFAA